MIKKTDRAKFEFSKEKNIKAYTVTHARDRGITVPQLYVAFVLVLAGMFYDRMVS